MISLVWLILLCYSSVVITQDSSLHDTAAQSKNIFLLAGQSNMAGRGGVVNEKWDGCVPPESYPDPRILRLSAGLVWEVAQEPLHRDIDTNRTCGIGPGMSFARSVLGMAPGFGEIGLVPCAVGGANINHWKRGGFLYNQLVGRAQAAVMNGGGLIRAILWYQGESDTREHGDAECYKRRLEQFFTDIRFDLQSPLLPIIQVALASGEGTYTHIIRKAQLETELPNVRCVDAKGLQLEPDELHLTTPAQVQLGEMLANSFLQITPPLPVPSSATRRFHNFFQDLLLRLFKRCLSIIP